VTSNQGCTTEEMARYVASLADGNRRLAGLLHSWVRRASGRMGLYYQQNRVYISRLGQLRRREKRPYRSRVFYNNHRKDAVDPAASFV
jgi:hypothetical protein